MGVHGEERVPSVTPSIGTAAYSVGDAIGGLMTVPDAAAQHSGGVLSYVSVVDLAKNNTPIDVLFYKEAITPTADNSEMDAGDTDLTSHFMFKVSILSGDYVSLADNSVATSPPTAYPFRADGSGKIYAQARMAGTATMAAGDLTFKFGIMRD